MAKLYGPAYKIDAIGSYTITHGIPTGHWLIYDGHGNPLFNDATFIAKFNSVSKSGITGWDKYGGHPYRIDAYRQSGYYSLYISLSINGGTRAMNAVAATTSLSDFRTACADWGVAINETTYSQDEHDYITLSGVTGGYETKEVDKLYGPIDDGGGGYETVRVEKLYGPADDGNGGYVTELIYEDTNV